MPKIVAYNNSQRLEAAVRPALFWTGIEEFPYACAGSLFVVRFKGRHYGITCQHVISRNAATGLMVMPASTPKKGDRPAEISRYAFVEDGDTDLADIAVICFAPHVDCRFFGAAAYTLVSGSYGRCAGAARLRVFGYIKEKTIVDYERQSITGGYCNLEFRNAGCQLSDRSLITGLAFYGQTEVRSLDGLSGSPVFDEDDERLCGMVVRAGAPVGLATIRYMDITYVVDFLNAVRSGSSRVKFSSLHESGAGC